MNLIDPQQLNNPDDILTEIDRVLAYLRLMACAIPENELQNPASMKLFSSHVGWLKAHFERLEALSMEDSQ